MRKLSLFALFLLTACTTEPQPDTGRSASPVASEVRIAGVAETILAQPPAAVIERAAAVLRERGFETTGVYSPSRSIEARSAGTTEPAWAICPAITVRDPFAEAFRSRSAEATDARSTVTVLAAGAPNNATRLIVRARHIGTYLNSYTNNPQEAACRSTGVLEQEILEAVSNSR
jgi:hypothetical protein